MFKNFLKLNTNQTTETEQEVSENNESTSLHELQQNMQHVFQTEISITEAAQYAVYEDLSENIYIEEKENDVVVDVVVQHAKKIQVFLEKSVEYFQALAILIISHTLHIV